ncbi:hypothetical protein AVEN_223332-1, partial [Araneus ventricosus]
VETLQPRFTVYRLKVGLEAESEDALNKFKQTHRISFPRPFPENELRRRKRTWSSFPHCFLKMNFPSFSQSTSRLLTSRPFLRNELSVVMRHQASSFPSPFPEMNFPSSVNRQGLASDPLPENELRRP